MNSDFSDESSLEFVVPIKQVPDMEEVKFDREEGRIDRSSAGAEPNPFDLNALEEAVRFKEEVEGHITVVSMGPPNAEDTLRDALARGADRAVLLTDKEFAGSDTWATSLTLAAAIRKIDNFSLIICGEKTVDGDTGQVGPEIAELLNIPHVAYVSDVLERSIDRVVVASDTWGRTYVRSLKLPGLITVRKDVNEPRLPSFKNKMKARKAEIETWRLSDLSGLSGDKVGLQGSRTMVNQIEVAPEAEREGEIIRMDPEESVKKLISLLERDGILQRCIRSDEQR